MSWWLLAGPARAAGPPPPSPPPTISGIAQQGQVWTLTPGTWTTTPPATIGDQWQRCDSAGANCANIAGATGASYTLTGTDVGKTIQVVETANDATGTSTANSALSPVVLPPPPSNNAQPAIYGPAEQGQTLVDAHGSWNSLAPFTYSYQWQRCDGAGNNCTAIAGAAGQIYVLTALDIGHTIVVQEFATSTGGTAGPANSAPTAVVVPPPPPSNASPPRIFGPVAQGETLTEVNGVWGNSPTSFSYQWQDCDGAGNNCTAIAGATGQTYTLTAADVGHTIVVRESATNAGGTGAPASSRTAVVMPHSSSITLTAVPNALVTNQGVTLIATITSSSSTAPLSGKVTFENGGVPIRGCAFPPEAVNSQSLTVTCQTSFAGSGSPEQLTAVFTPDIGTTLAGSTSATDRLVVSRDPTSTDLQVSNSTVSLGSSAIYTATVTPGHSGSVQPSGSVSFLDRGKPIGPCRNQRLTKAAAFFIATCNITYGGPGTHQISAVYSGDANFTGSGSSSVQPISVQKLPPRVQGVINSLLQWTFSFTSSYTKVSAFVVTGAPVGANVLVTCRGQGCAFAKRSTAIKQAKPCKATPKRKCAPQHPGTVDVAPSFRGRHLNPGTRITVQIVRPGWIGKYYSFTLRAGQPPRWGIGCLALGSSRPGVGC